MRCAAVRRTAVRLLGLALVGAVLVATGPAEQADTRPVSQSRPTNAGKVFRWGNAQWADDFIGPVKGMWAQNRPGQVNNQHGMLTINGSAGGGDVVATVTGHARAVRPLGDPRPRRAVQPRRTRRTTWSPSWSRPATTTAARATSCSRTTRSARAGPGWRSATCPTPSSPRASG